MKKLLKSKICGFVNSAHRALFTEKVKYFSSKKKKTKETQNVRLAHTLRVCLDKTYFAETENTVAK